MIYRNMKSGNLICISIEKNAEFVKEDLKIININERMK